MAALGFQFNAATVAPSQSFDPIPKGDYLAVIVASDMKTAKSGGQYLELELEVLDGNFKGRKVWDRLNLKNANPKTVEIAQRQLSALCHATGVMTPTDSMQFHNIPVIAVVVYDEAANGYSASNSVKNYKSASSGATPVQAPTPAYTPPAYQAAAQAAAPMGATPPWGRK